MVKTITTCDGCGKDNSVNINFNIQKTLLPRDEHWNFSENDLCLSCRWDFQAAGWKALKDKLEQNKVKI